MAFYFARYATAWTLRGYKLVDRATGQYKILPTLAAGDFKIEKDGGSAANLAALPTVAPPLGSSIGIAFSAAEMLCAQAVINLHDVAGDEWDDDVIHIFTMGNPSAFFPFDLFTPTVALNPASRQEVTGGVWDELRANHTIPDTFGGSSGLSATDIDNLLDETIGDGTLTMREALRLCAGVLGGKISGAESTVMTIRNVADTADLLICTKDGFGNRLNIVLNL